MNTLAAPTAKQTAVLRHWANCRVSSSQATRDAARTDFPLSEDVVAYWLQSSDQAGIAVLSDMVRKGWLKTNGERRGIYWDITEKAAESLELFADGQNETWPWLSD